MGASPEMAAGGDAASSPALDAGGSGSPQVRFLPPPQSSLSGWERLRALLRRDELKSFPEETADIIRTTVLAGIVGLFYGGIPGFIYAKKRYIEQSGAEVYHNQLDAMQSVHRAGIRSFVRYGWRWGWRAAAFVGIFNTVSVCLSVYRDKASFSHFVIAGGCTGGLFRMNLGLRGLVGGTCIGALLGVPAGGFVMAMHSLTGESLDERRKRVQRQQYEQEVAKWSKNLSITKNIGREMDNVSQERTEERDSGKMQEF